MTLTEVTLQLRDELASNAEVDSWCVEKFGKQAKFYAGFNVRKPPKDSELPTVILIPDETDVDESGRRTFTIGLVWAVSSSESVTDGNRVTLAGCLLADEFGELLMGALSNFTNSFRITASGYNLPWNSLQFPTFAGEATLTISEW